MIKITIPANQTVKRGEFMTVIIDSTYIYLMAKHDTLSASYEKSFYVDEFDISIHGFAGINDDLASLCYNLKNK
jgi:hypothetical protein